MNQPGSTYWRVIEAAYRDVSIHDGPFTFSAFFNKYPVHVRHLLATHWCQSEIENGGFHQFFLNPTGVLAPEAMDGFHALGLDGVARILDTAMQRLSAKYERDRDRREAHLAGRCFDDLDKLFYHQLRVAGGYAAVADAFAERFQ